MSAGAIRSSAAGGEESPPVQVPARKTRSLPRMLYGESVQQARPNGTEREARIAVLGHDGVGKTALVVRYLTKRFIGDYAHYETTTSFTTTLDSKPTCLWILDTTGEVSDAVKREEQVRWADGILLVFSVTDRTSFQSIRPMVDYVTRSRGGRCPPVVLVGNKCDLCHVREVSETDGKKLAKKLTCTYLETSASDSYTSVSDAFACLLREIVKAQRKDGDKKGGKKNGTSKIAQLRETIRNWTEFRMRTNTF